MGIRQASNGGHSSRRRTVTGLVIGVVAGAAVLAACGSDEDASDATEAAGAIPVAQFAGEIAGGTAEAPRLLAVVASGDTALAYLCDGADEVVWFAGTVEGDHLELTDREGTPLSLDADADSVTGTLAGDAIELAAVADPSGLYVLAPSTDQEVLTGYLGGWIVLPDGRQTGGVRSGSGVTNPPLDVSKRTVSITDGTSNTVVSFGTTAASGGFQFQFGSGTGSFGGFGQFGGSGFSQFGGIQFGQFGSGASTGIQFGG